MKYTLSGKKIQFETAFSDVKQLADWFLQNRKIKGFCFVGRSNVGKSMLINALFNNKITRTSNAPGRTRNINLFLMKENPDSWNKFPVYFFDLPGHGYAKVSKALLKKWNEIIDQFFNLIPHTLAVVNIQDARHLNQKSDQMFFQYIQDRKNKTFLVCNKIDKLKNQKQKHLFQNEKKKFLSANKIEHVYCISAKNKQGIKDLEISLIDFLLNAIATNSNLGKD
ncbi:MAG: ribosome biogenesis GTP-binding protein YihA/YsxC [Halobacteriovoraceae bacterium]|nr:ribosome biogenesis GTP-binding protein YihA/YsxC [Halobacteriovoraceae bacterium]